MPPSGFTGEIRAGAVRCITGSDCILPGSSQRTREDIWCSRMEREAEPRRRFISERLCPEQVRVIPISDKYHDYAGQVEAKLKTGKIEVEEQK